MRGSGRRRPSREATSGQADGFPRDDGPAKDEVNLTMTETLQTGQDLSFLGVELVLLDEAGVQHGLELL